MFDNRQQSFSLGQIVATPGALEGLQSAGVSPREYLSRHQAKDWGDLSPLDVAENERSVRAGCRVLSAYRLLTGVRIWIITEADRSVTTILLPSEY